MEKKEEKHSVIRSAAAMSLGTILSRVLGLIRDVMMAAYFSRTVTDAFVVAFRLPNMFRRVLGEGSLSVSFVPIYVERKSLPAGGGAKLNSAQNLANGIFTLLMMTTGLLSVMGWIWMPEIMKILVAGESYQSIVGKFQVTVRMGQIMSFYLLLVTLYAFYMAIANAWKKFLVPALGPVLFNIVFIIFTMIPDQWGGTAPGEFLAWGVLWGGVAQMVLVGYMLHKMNVLPRLCWRPWNIPSVKRVLINMLPGVAGLGVLQIIAVVNVNLASHLPEGAHSYIYWGDRVLELPQAIIAVSLGSALLPTLSQLFVEGKHQEMLNTAASHLQLLMFLTLPCAVGLFLIAHPLSEALFMRGQFTQSDADTTAQVIQIYTLLLVASSLSRVLVPSFYARKNTWLPATVSALTLVFHISVAIKMTEWWGLIGLVGATTFSGFFNVFALTVCYRFFLGPLGIKPLLQKCLVWLPGLLIMGGWVWLCQFFINHGLEVVSEGRGMGKSLRYVIQLLVMVGPGALFYMLICAYMGAEEASQVLKLFKRKFFRFKSQ